MTLFMLAASCLGADVPTVSSSGSGCGCGASLSGDPHVVGADGDQFSLRGDHLGIYNMLSAPNVSFNAQFKWLPFDSPYSHVRVNGTFARVASWVLRSSTGQNVQAQFAVQ